MAICIVCKQTVTPKTGIQCQGSCSAWVHFGCLDYVTDDGRKMVHEPYSNVHMYSDVCVVTQMSDMDKKNKWNNNYDSHSDHDVNMNETASQVTQETATKSVCQGDSIYKSASLGMFSWADTTFFGYSPQPLEDIPCGNVPHILLPTPFPIQYFPTANQYGENPNKVRALNAPHGFNGMKPRERPHGERFSPTSTATETDEYNIVTLDSHKRNFPVVSYIKPNSHSKSNFHDLQYLHTSQHPYGSYRSRITNLLSLSDSLNKTLMNSANLATLNTVKCNVTGMQKWESSMKQDINKESDTLFKNNSAAIVADPREPRGPCQGSELPDILERPLPAVTAEIKVSLRKSKSTPLHASPQATLPRDHLKTNKNAAVVTDKMVENVPLEAQCQTSNIQTFSEVKNYAVLSTNTSIENSVALLSKSVGSCSSKCSPLDVLKIIKTSTTTSDAPSCLDAKSNVENQKCKNVSTGNSVTNLDASLSPIMEIVKSFNKDLSAGHISSWTKLDASELPDEISKQQIDKILGKLIHKNTNRNLEETDDTSSENVLTACINNVLSTFEMLSSQICDIFYNRKQERVSNYCRAARSEGVISIVRANINSSNVFEKKQECLTVKLLNFRKD